MRKAVFSCKTQQLEVRDMTPEEEAEMQAHYAAEEARQALPKPKTLAERVAELETKIVTR